MPSQNIYDPMDSKTITVKYQGVEPFTAEPVKIVSFCDKTLALPESMNPKDVEASRIQKKKIVCVLDESHLLEKETIEKFRFLLNYKFDSMSPMSLVLVGQTELWDKLRLQRYAAVQHRIDINCILPHLNRTETEKYVQSHLDYADGKQDIFTDHTLDDIYKKSTGIPRRINRICEKCLM